MSKSTVIKAACGGLFIGVSATSILFNSAMNSPAIFIASGIFGLVVGCGLLAVAYRAA